MVVRVFNAYNYVKISTKDLKSYCFDSTVSIMDLDNLNLVKIAFGGKLEPIFTNASAALKYEACFQSGPNRLKNIHLTS